MNFQELSIRNFLAIQEAHLTFPAGIHLIHGINRDMSANGQESNGSGKSSLMDALLWVLYGVVGRGKVKEDDVINKAEGKNCRVEVKFSHGGKTFRIVRYRKDDDEKGSGVRWWLDGKEMSSHRSGDTQTDLEKELPVSRSVFQHAVQVGQGMPDRFLDLSETAKQELLGEIVDLTGYDRALDRTKDQIASLSTQSAVAKGNLESVKTQIDRVKSDLELKERALQAYQVQSATDVATISKEITKLDADSAETQKGKERLEASISTVNKEVQDSSAGLIGLRSDRGILVSQVATLRAEVQSLQSQQDRLAATPDVCPTCKRPMDGRDGIFDSIMEIAMKQDTKAISLKESEVKLAESDKTYNNKEKEVEKARNFLSQIERQIREQNDKIMGMAKKRNEVESRKSYHDRQIATLTSAVETVKENLTKLSESITPMELRVKDLGKELAHWEFWKTAIPNLRAAAMEEVLGYINERLSHYMDIFSGGAMGIRLFQEAYGKGSKIRVELKTPAGTYDLSSGGEKRRVDLSLYLALSDLLQTSSGMCCNLLTADEICDGLSPLGVRQFLDVLKVLAQSGRCVFVMSHNSSVSSQFEFDSVRVVERRDGRATLLPDVVS